MFAEDDEEQEALPSLEKPGWYSQGNAAHLYQLLKKMTGKPQPKVLLGGDRVLYVCLLIRTLETKTLAVRGFNLVTCGGIACLCPPTTSLLLPLLMK